MTDRIVLVGGGGHCKSCIEVLESAGMRAHGVLDRSNDHAAIAGAPLIGNDDAIAGLAADHSFLITVGQLKNAGPRVRLYEQIKSANGKLALVISGNARMSRHAEAGEGTIVMQQCIVNADARIGVNCIINNMALIEHDCRVGDHTHISTGAILNGACTVGSRVFIGSRAVLANGVRICDDVVVGAGSVVIKNIEEPGVYAGNPARKING